MSIKDSELILNPDGSVYHLNLKPENVAETIILVGDQDRVEKVSMHFDTIDFVFVILETTSVEPIKILILS